MANILYNVGQFNTSTATDAVDTTVWSQTDKPKLVMFFGGPRTDNATTATTSGAHLSIGAVDQYGTMACGMMSVIHGSAQISKSRMQTDVAWGIMNLAGTASTMDGCLTATMRPGAFRTIATTAFPADYVVDYFALGGPGVEEVHVVPFNQPTATGSFTVSGMNFSPDAYFVVCSNSSNFGTTGANGALSLGWGIGATCHSVAFIHQDGSSPDNAYGIIHTDRACAMMSASTGALQNDFDTVSIDADGVFTFNKRNGTAARCCFLVGIKGPQFALDTTTNRTTTGTKTTTAISTFTPVVVLMGFHHLTTATETTGDTPSAVGFGAMDDTGREWAYGLSVNDGATPTQARTGQKNDAAIFAIAEDGSAEVEATISGMQSTGIALSYSNPDAQASLLTVFMIGHRVGDNKIPLAGINRGMT